MGNGQSDTRLLRQRVLGFGALVVCVCMIVSVAIQRRPPPSVIRLVGVEAAPSLEEWLSAASPEGYVNWYDGEEDVVGSWPDDHQCVVAHASILMRAMRPTENPAIYGFLASDLCLAGSQGTTHDGVMIAFGHHKATLTPSLYTSDRASLLTPWVRNKRYPARVVFAVPVVSIPDRFTLRYADRDVASFELEGGDGAVGVDPVGLD